MLGTNSGICNNSIVVKLRTFVENVLTLAKCCKVETNRSKTGFSILL